ncbi:MAG: magnesium-translocating P-type ATPase [Candidatus Nomurabacteria bacterium]|nr:magnesium-translocating P-type ATPase [Candidatus Nomurabacteria bacterium]
MQGLTTNEAISLLKTWGKNEVEAREKQSAFKTFLNEFKSPLIILLLFATVISFISGSYISTILILAIIFASSIIDFSISYKSQKTVEMLLAKVAPEANVWRDGVVIRIPVVNLVPGDCIAIKAGDVVSADAEIVEGNSIFINESSLTGESLPVGKPIGEKIYLGSGVVTGYGIAKVTETGKRTKFANIVLLLSSKEVSSEFERGIKSFSFLIMKAVVCMAVVVFLVNALTKGNVIESLLFALALAVGITPELLPMIIALNISKASIKMSHKGVLIKKLSVVENFGSMNVLCTDKTGTLTEDKIEVVKYLDLDGNDSSEVLRLGFANSYLHTGTKTPLDEAIEKYKDFDLSFYKKVSEIPFDFERRRDSVVFELVGEHTLVSKGAPEYILQSSNIDSISKQKADDLFNKLSKEGYRVLAIGVKTMTEKKDSYDRNDEHDLKLAGFIAFFDPPKKDVKEVLDELKIKGISIKIITGDHPLVALHVAREVGLDTLHIIENSEIDLLSDEELKIKVNEISIFARATPAQKNRIIKALQANGHVVGYMGDGINDAPALRMADVGISVNNAVDVAKEAADIILMKKSFSELINGVIEGRKTFANTMKYISMAVSSNFGNMISMTISSIFLPFLPMTAVQLLLNNLLYESSQFSLSYDNVESEYLNKPKPWDIKYIKKFMFAFGLTSAFYDLLTFAVLFKVFNLVGSGFQTGWFVESFITQTLVIFFIRSNKSFFKSEPAHKIVVCAMFGAVIIALGIALSSLGHFFGFTPLPLVILFVIVGITICYFITVEMVKRVFYKKVLV